MHLCAAYVHEKSAGLAPTVFPPADTIAKIVAPSASKVEPTLSLKMVPLLS